MWGALATVGAAGISAASQYATNQANIHNSNARFGDQINLANTQHQREVIDLRAAGLNPILSAQGNGAAVPQGNIPQMDNPLSGLTDGINSALTGYQQRQLAKQSIRKSGAEVDNLVAQNDNLRAQNSLLNAQTAKTLKEASSAGEDKYGKMRETVKETAKQLYNAAEDFFTGASSARQAYELKSSEIDKRWPENPFKFFGKVLNTPSKRDRLKEKARRHILSPVMIW